MQQEGFQGTVTGISLPELIQLFCTGYKEVKIRVHSPKGNGVICIAGGQISHAETTNNEGEAAFYEIMSWDSGEFTTLPLDDQLKGNVTIHKSWEQLLLEAVRISDEKKLSAKKESEEFIVAYCNGCQKRFYIPAEKIPFGKKVKVKCPSCKNEIIVEREENLEDVFDAEIEKWKYEEAETSTVLDEFVEDVLICTPNDEISSVLKKQLEEHGYQIYITKRGRDGFFALRKGNFRIVIVDEDSGGKGAGKNLLLYYLQRLPMNIRRKFCLCVLSNQHKTGDVWSAFKIGADIVVNKDNVSVAADLIHHTMMRLKTFYEPYIQELEILRAE